MKKLIFGMAFLASIAFSGSFLFAQTMAGPGDGGGSLGEKWVCCKETDVFCTDIHGNARADSTKKSGRFCP